MRRRLAALPVLALSALSLLPATSAEAMPLHCGDTITASVVLTSSLNCSGDGLIVGANNLTIDLNGKRISGSGGGTGIQISPSLPSTGLNLTVRGGTIQRFGTAIDVENDGLLSLSNVRLSTNTLGLGSLALGLTAQVAGSTFTANTTAIGSNSFPGFQATLHVTGSSFHANPVAIDLLANSRIISVDGSSFTGNGIALEAHNGTVTVTNSRFVDNPTAIVASEDGMTVTGNTIRGSKVGLDIADDYYFMTVTGNRITGSGIGIRLTGVNGGSSPTVAHNVLTGNGSAGLFANLIAGGITVESNLVRNNGAAPAGFTDPDGNPLIDGIWANHATITANTAISNAGYGIAGYGVTDGGGNIARGNGNPAQCLGVSCTRH